MSIATKIYIVPLEFEHPELLDKLSLSLNQVFNIPIQLLPIDINLRDGLSPGQDQLNSTWLLSQLLRWGPDDNSKIIGVTAHDLYIPILTFLFGEAELGGRAAVFSIHRFKDELYGLPANLKNLEDRMLKEAVHELGHTFGLRHCRNFDCVMHASSYIEEFDFKNSTFCGSCNTLLEETMNS